MNSTYFRRIIEVKKCLDTDRSSLVISRLIRVNNLNIRFLRQVRINRYLKALDRFRTVRKKMRLGVIT